MRNVEKQVREAVKLFWLIGRINGVRRIRGRESNPIRLASPFPIPGRADSSDGLHERRWRLALMHRGRWHPCILPKRIRASGRSEVGSL